MFASFVDALFIEYQTPYQWTCDTSDCVFIWTPSGEYSGNGSLTIVFFGFMAFQGFIGKSIARECERISGEFAGPEGLEIETESSAGDSNLSRAGESGQVDAVSQSNRTSVAGSDCGTAPAGALGSQQELD